MERMKRGIAIASIILLTMLIVPIITTMTVKDVDGMAVTLLLLFVVQPMASSLVGILAGRDIRFFWPTPLLVAVLSWVFACVVYEPAFPVVYAVSYMIVCAVSMLLTWIISRKTK